MSKEVALGKVWHGIDEQGKHWVWRGSRDVYAGGERYRVQSLIYERFRGLPTGRLRKTCRVDGCVNPECFTTEPRSIDSVLMGVLRPAGQCLVARVPEVKYRGKLVSVKKLWLASELGLDPSEIKDYTTDCWNARCVSCLRMKGS